MKTCGDHGGLGRKSGPCKRAAGWATGHPGSGRCHDHDQVAIEDREARKSRFLELLGDAAKTWVGAADEAGIARRTLYEWIADDRAFGERARAARDAQRPKRIDLWEDSAFTRILGGKASAALEIFWVVNNADDRYRDLRHIDHGVTIGVGVMMVPGGVNADEWDRAARQHQARLPSGNGNQNGRGG